MKIERTLTKIELGPEELRIVRDIFYTAQLYRKQHGRWPISCTSDDDKMKDLAEYIQLFLY